MGTPFTLTLLSPGLAKGRVWRFASGSVVLGSAPGCDVELSVPGLAARHVRLEFNPEALGVEDLGSVQRTIVDGGVISGRMEVAYPASLKIGEAVFAVNVEKLEASGVESFRGGVADVSVSYKLTREVAKGGMGRIYEGYDSQLRRKLAVKVSSQDSAADDARFFREAEILARLAHPNIVPVYNRGWDRAGHPAYSMKLVKGQTLQSVLHGLRQGDEELRVQFSLKRLLTVFEKVCGAIGFAHTQGFLHRDLKPENIMIGEFGEVLVMDWGLAKGIWEATSAADWREQDSKVKRSGDGGIGETLEGDVIGSPQYMSPEQACGQMTDMDPRSDIYSLGAILYAIVTLRAPVEGASVDEILERVRSGNLEPLYKKGDLDGRLGEAAEALHSVVLKAMELSKEDRYLSVEDFLADLHAYQDGYATEAENASFLRQLVLLVRRNRTEALMLGILLCASAAFMLKLAASRRVAKDSARVAVLERGVAQRNAKKAEANAEKALANEQRALEEKELARRAAARAQLALAEAAQQRWDGKAIQLALAEVPEDLRDQSWEYLAQRLNPFDATFEASEDSPFLSVLGQPQKPGVFVTVQENGWVRTLDIHSGKRTDLFQLKQPSTPTLAVLSQDGAKLAVVKRDPETSQNECFVEVWRMSDGQKLLATPKLGQTRRLSFSPDGQLVLLEPRTFPLTPEESVFQVWDTETGQLLWKGGSTTTAFGEFSADSASVRIVAYGPEEREAMVTDYQARTGVEEVVYPGRIQFNWFPSGQRGAFLYATEPKESAIFSIHSGFLMKLDLKNGEHLFRTALPVRNVLSLAYMPSSDAAVITLSRTTERAGVLQFWDAESGTGQRSLLLSARSNPAQWRIAVHPDSGDVVVSDETCLRVLKFTRPQASHRFNGQNQGGVGFLGEALLCRSIQTKAYSRQWEVQILDLKSASSGKTPIFKEAFQGTDRVISASADGNTLCARSGLDVHVYQREKGVFTKVAQWKAATASSQFF